MRCHLRCFRLISLVLTGIARIVVPFALWALCALVLIEARGFLHLVGSVVT